MALAAACAHLGGARPAQTATGEARAPYAGGLRSTALPASDDAAPAGAATTASIELRASWTALDSDLGPHLLAFTDVLAAAAGLPPEGVAVLGAARRRS